MPTDADEVLKKLFERKKLFGLIAELEDGTTTFEQFQRSKEDWEKYYQLAGADIYNYLHPEKTHDTPRTSLTSISCKSQSINGPCSTGRHTDRFKGMQKRFKKQSVERDACCIATGVKEGLVAAHIVPLDKSELTTREYYRSRAAHLSKKLIDNNNKRYFLEAVFSVILRKSVGLDMNETVRKSLINTGLLRQENNSLIAYNGFALKGIMMEFENNFVEWLRFSYGFGSESTKGDVLELFVWYSFQRKINQTIILTVTNLKGSLAVTNQLKFKIDEFHTISKSELYDDEHNYLGQNILLRCYEGHPVVDFVFGGTVNGIDNCVLFIQASKSPYSKHESKLENLCEVNEKKTTIMDLYLYKFNRDGITAQADTALKENGTMPPNVYYVYVTLSTDLWQKQKSWGNANSVLLVQPNFLNDLNNKYGEIFK